MKVIHAYVYNPSNHIFGNKSDKAELRLIHCENSQNCELYQNKQCHYRRSTSKGKCPYGKRTRKYGYTQRARKFYSWILSNKEKYSEYLGALERPNDRIAFIGDYVYLPYSYLDNMNNPLMRGEFLEKEKFTTEFINKMIDFKPRSLMGGTISDYQKEELPRFLVHLNEGYPEIFNEIKNDKVLKIISEYSNVGRKALLSTLKKGCIINKPKTDTKWKWDGEFLISENVSLFLPITKPKELICKLKPEPGAVVKITDDSQVDENTKFVE